jgi:hypothetical protein
LEIVGLEKAADLEAAKKEAERHNSRYPDHEIRIRGYHSRIF